MIRGLVIGKFMPVHNGHQALIYFAAERCDELIVSMSYTPSDPIAAHIRLKWLREIFKGNSKLYIQQIEDDFDQPHLPPANRTAIWAAQIKKHYGKVDVVFSSEDYGEPFAAHLGARHISFDRERKMIPVSATQIRQHTLRNWDYLPAVVRPYYVKKICFYGPESTGKSTLAEKMAARYQTHFVPEVAREMITSNNFTIEDIIRIGQAQTERVRNKQLTAHKLLLCDTDLITTQIYSQHYLGVVPAELIELERQIKYDLYFLFDVDVPWVSDGLRDLGHKRAEMFRAFRSELEKRKIPFLLVQGTYAQREEFVQKHLDKLLTS